MESFSEQFMSDDNLKEISGSIMREIKYNVDNYEDIVFKSIKNYANSWVKLGKFKDIDYDMQNNNYKNIYYDLKKYNTEFKHVFLDSIANDVKNARMNNMKNNNNDNYRQKYLDRMTENYNEFYAQNDEDMTFNYNRPKSLKDEAHMLALSQAHKRHFDTIEKGSLKFESSVSIKPRRYDMLNFLKQIEDN